MFFNRISFALFTLTLFYKGIVFYVNKIFSIFIFRDKIKEINSFEIRSHNFNNKIFEDIVHLIIILIIIYYNLC